MAQALIANTRIIDVGEDMVSVCRPTDDQGWPADECGAVPRYVAYHIGPMAPSSPMSEIGKGHQVLCLNHAREQAARCLHNTCRGAY
jgi:hypothetical protein